MQITLGNCSPFPKIGRKDTLQDGDTRRHPPHEHGVCAPRRTAPGRATAFPRAALDALNGRPHSSPAGRSARHDLAPTADDVSREVSAPTDLVRLVFLGQELGGTALSSCNLHKESCL